MNKVLCVYDDSLEPGQAIKNIVGNKTFGRVILKRQRLHDICLKRVLSHEFIFKILEIFNWDDKNQVLDKIRSLPPDMPIVHIFSNYAINDYQQFDIILQKSQFIHDNIVIMSPTPAVLMFRNSDEYAKYLQLDNNLQDNNIFDHLLFEKIDSNVFTDVSIRKNFLQYISSGFDARFFNSLQGNEYIVTKSSNKKEKIKSEYTYYHLLPEEMKMWFVRPFHYVESEKYSSYSMERYNITDLAVRWVHGAITIEEFNDLLEKTFYFIKSRSVKQESRDNYEQLANRLYIKKIDERIEELKKHDAYDMFDNYIHNGTVYNNIDDVIKVYKNLYLEVTANNNIEYKSVIGHGDLCFSNMLYNRETSILRLIDPKGAIIESDLWTNPYYDIAKLSHSICGKYDFFNNGLYDVILQHNLKFELTIDFDNTEYIKMFRMFVEKNGFNYKLVRLYEASLFLSMLPLHMDNPHKVFGLLLNAIGILEEVKLCFQK